MARTSSGAAYLLWMASVYVAARVGAALFFYLEVETGPDIDRWNRIANVRVLPESAQGAALRSFLSRATGEHARSGRRDVVLVAGDSQLYGYFLPADRTTAARLAEEVPWASVYNASRVGASYSWAQAALESAVDEGLAPRVLVLNANPALAGESATRFGGSRVTGSLLGSLLLSKEAMGMAGDILRARLRKGTLPFDPYDTRPAPPGDGTYQVAALRQDYYPARLPAHTADSLRSLLEFSRGKVELVVVVASPHHYAPYNEAPYRYGWDTSPVVREAMAICSRFDHAACLDRSTAYGREYFHDVIHLNEAGHRKLAAEIAAVIRSRLRRPSPQ